MPMLLRYAGLRLVRFWPPAVIRLLKKFADGDSASASRVPLTAKKSPVMSSSPSYATAPNLALTAPCGGARKPLIEVFTAESLTDAYPLNTVRSRSGAVASWYATTRLHRRTG